MPKEGSTSRATPIGKAHKGAVATPSKSKAEHRAHKQQSPADFSDSMRKVLKGDDPEGEKNRTRPTASVRRKQDTSKRGKKPLKVRGGVKKSAGSKSTDSARGAQVGSGERIGRVSC